MNPFLGVIFHWLGGFASGSFYVQYRSVKRWSWETYWLVGGFFSWIICPWILAFALTHDVMGVLQQQSVRTLWWTYFFGALWGFGGLTYGLTMRYLGMSLGNGMSLGYCAAFGTLLPPLFKSLMPGIPVAESLGQIMRSGPGQITLVGVAVCLLGIGITALAGYTKEREMPQKEKQATIAEFHFSKGAMLATFCGIMSACFAFALAAGNPIGEASRVAGTPELWTGLPKLTVVLLGGFTTNFIWCVILHIRNRSGYQYLASELRPEHAGPSDSPYQLKVPRLRNYIFAALAGTTWYFQYFFYTMGEMQMGKYGFASWTLHMASIIIFSTMWGGIFHEWKGASGKAKTLMAAGIVVLVLSTMVIGYGSFLKGRSPG